LKQKKTACEDPKIQRDNRHNEEQCPLLLYLP
jgi:hypothetical protein